MGRIISGDERAKVMADLTKEFESLGIAPVFCSRCDHLTNWPKTEDRDPIKARMDADDLQVESLFCMCD